MTDQESLSKAASIIRSKEGYIDVLIANSGILGPLSGYLFPTAGGGGGLLGNGDDGGIPSIEEIQTKLWGISMEEFTKPMHVNVTGVFYTFLAFLDLLDNGNKIHNGSRPKSQVIIMASIAGLSRVPGAGFAYSASKSGAIHLAKQLSTCFAPYKIRANAIAPGLYPSEMTQNSPIIKQPNDPRVEGNVSAQTCPLQRTGAEEDMNGLALFLISRAGGYVNGNIQVTDGGRISVMPASY